VGIPKHCKHPETSKENKCWGSKVCLGKVKYLEPKMEEKKKHCRNVSICDAEIIHCSCDIKTEKRC